MQIARNVSTISSELLKQDAEITTRNVLSRDLKNGTVEEAVSLKATAHRKCKESCFAKECGEVLEVVGEFPIGLKSKLRAKMQTHSAPRSREAPQTCR